METIACYWLTPNMIWVHLFLLILLLNIAPGCMFIPLTGNEKGAMFAGLLKDTALLFIFAQLQK